MPDPCGNYNASGIITSPGFPFKYQNDNKECIYKIAVPQNNIIRISFFEFDLEHDIDCRNDFLEFKDGESEFSSLLGIFCGDMSNVQRILYSKQDKMGSLDKIPKILYSTQSKLWIRYVTVKIGENINAFQYYHSAIDNVFIFLRFYSNWDVSAHGFKLIYESIPLPCGAQTYFVAPSGHLSSLRYPFNYIGNPDCFYRISFKNGTIVKISIIDIQLNKTVGCTDSFLEIRDGKYSTSPLLSRLCGNTSDVPTSLQSTGPDVNIR